MPYILYFQKGLIIIFFFFTVINWGFIFTFSDRLLSALQTYAQVQSHTLYNNNDHQSNIGN